jgi:hypothetical protein
VLLATTTTTSTHTHTHVLYIRVFLCAQPHGVQHTEFLITRSQPIKVNMFSKAL